MTAVGLVSKHAWLDELDRCLYMRLTRSTIWDPRPILLLWSHSVTQAGPNSNWHTQLSTVTPRPVLTLSHLALHGVRKAFSLTIEFPCCLINNIYFRRISFFCWTWFTRVSHMLCLHCRRYALLLDLGYTQRTLTLIKWLTYSRRYTAALKLNDPYEMQNMKERENID